MQESIFSPQASPASPTLLPGTDAAMRMTARSGRKLAESYEKPGPVGSLLKTLLASPRWRSTECYLTWKPKTTPQGRLYFQLSHSTRHTVATESGSWPTMRAGDGPQHALRSPEKVINPRGRIEDDVALWATLTRNGNYNRAGLSPTSGDGIVTQARLWYTLTANDGKNSSLPISQLKRETSIVADIIGIIQSELPADESRRLYLNPRFCEWLMGYPIGWVASSCR